MRRSVLPAAVLCSAMLLHVLPVGASYTPEEIAFSIRPEGDTAVEGDGCVHVSQEEAAAGKTLHFGIYIEANRAEVQILGIRLQSNSPQLTFVKDSLKTGVTAGENASVYSLPDGTVFSTKYKPYCLGKVNSNGNYFPDCFSFNQNCEEDGTGLTLYWLSGTQQTTAFLGGQSDWFSFYEFDAALAPGTQPGTYQFTFVVPEDGNADTAKSERMTYVTSNDGTVQKADYHSVIPTRKEISIVVDGTPLLLGDVNHDGDVNAKDATIILKYSAKIGMGGSISAAERENLLQYGDVNHDSDVNAKDATLILKYSAEQGIGNHLTWEDIFS